MNRVITIRTITALLVLVLGTSAAQTSKPVIRLEPDGFPSGHGTPEGAACDLARAFIKRDVALFRGTCIAPFGDGQGRKQYEQFLKRVAQTMRDEAKRTQPSPKAPKELGKLFAARHLMKNGPSSYGYAAFGFKDVMFVDVGVNLNDGKRALNRTLVICDSKGKWYVHPLPSSSALLSDGLNLEKPSTRDFADAYTVHK